jgi:hypothetical protein
MAIIQSYPINDNIKDADLLLGVTNIAPSGNPIYQTKSFRVSDIREGGGLITLTTNGTSGPATLVGNVLNIPQYPTIGSLEFNSTDLTVWNNGKGNVTTNTSFGDLTLISNTTGDANSAIGYRALSANTVGGGNTAIGLNSLRFNTQGNFNTSIGWASMSANISGVENTALGAQSLDSNTTGNYNVSIGSRVLSNNTTGQYNTAVGMQAMGNNESGTNNTALGYAAGIGATGASSNNVYIGNRAGPSSAIAINNKLYISNDNGTPLIGGDFAAKTVSIDGSLTATKFILPADAPATMTSTGVVGEIRYDANFIYICIATNSWKRAPIYTFS